ncbi:MAG TPA: hypothetical protein VFT95_14805, partial [Micromonosporaceae bacterium]|nr:hypothetical protein [Micromonosporaceae bacterium]
MRAAAHLLLAVIVVAGCLEAPPAGGGPPATDANQTPRAWTDRTGAAIAPALFGPRLAYDSTNGVVLSYGGSLGVDNAQATSSFMAWDGDEWTMLCDDCAPGPRLFHGFAFDSARGRAVLYGGIDDLGAVNGDLWEWDGTDWLSLPVPRVSGPGPRSRFWMAYDPGRGRMVLFGGDTDGGTTLSSELFEYDGETWYALGQGGGPGARNDDVAPAAYDPIGQRVLIYGSKEQADDLWGWDGVSWTHLCDPCTGVPRASAMLGVDPARERIVIVGGYDPQIVITGTWELYPDGDLACASAEPSQRDTSGMTRDPSRDVMVLFGGNGFGCAGNCSETLELVYGEGGDCN